MKKLLFILLISLLAGFAFSIVAQDEDEDPPVLQLNVGGVTCDLAIVESSPEMESTEEPEMESTEEAEPEPEIESTEEPEMESTEEAEYPIITLSEDCENLLSQLRVAQNGTLWIALSVPDEEEWQEFSTLDDESDLQFDRRGRYVGCQNPEEGEQICSVTWVQGDVTYVIEIPIVVGNAFVAPSLPTPIPANSSESSADPVSSTGDGQWGACGSCDSCGANSNLCVTSPDGQCVADPARCEIRPPSSSGGGGAPGPATTEEP